MTQEEFEDIVYETCNLAANGMSYMIPDKWLYNNRPGTIEVVWDCSNDVWTKLNFIPDDPNLKSIEKLFPSADAQSIYWYGRYEEDVYHEFFYIICEAYTKYQELLFSTCSLDTIKENVLVEKQNPNELFQQNNGDHLYTSPWFLLVNPRKDVVEWALQNFEYKSQPKVQEGLDLVEDRQAIPELKELILNTLELKGE